MSSLQRPTSAHAGFVFLLLLAATGVGCGSASRIYVSPPLRDAAAQEDTDVAGAAAGDSALGAEVAYRVLLVGDAGAPEEGDPLLATLAAHAAQAGDNSLTVFLGDNVYDDGMPPEGDLRRPEAERRLQAQIDAVAVAPGRAIFLPGNHDWNHSRAGGLEQLARQEAYVESALGPGSFLPSRGFPGPVSVELAEDLRLIVLDTEWWLGRYARGEGLDEESGAFFGEDDDFLLALNEAVQDAAGERLLVVAHHPIFSNGDRAGVVPPERHLFPLIGTIPNAYVPLPFIGSLILAVRQTIGEDEEDLEHPRYRALRAAMTDAFSQHEALIYAAGHEHSLQYFAVPSGRTTFHQIVSGSGSEPEYVGIQDAGFAASVRGFFVLTYYDDGSARMDAITPADGRPMGDTLVSVRILEASQEAPAPDSSASASRPPALPATATAPVAPRYGDAGGFSRLFVGQGYREAWATPVTAPVLDLGREAGGLTPVRLGGGRQTLSLRLRAEDGSEFKLRSIEKDPQNPLGLGFRHGRAHEFAQDITSGMYPFGAIVAARLAAAAGLYHTNPRLFYVPDDARLGPFREAFAEQMMLLEEHPNGDGRGRPHFGEAEDLISPAQLYRALDGDADHRVDADFYLRTRLFDMLIGDWDRHRDQWRWAAFEPGELDPTLAGDDATDGKVYRPIGVDRDWALNDRDGLVFGLARPFLPKLQGLQSRYGNVNGHTLSGREQDRRFLAPLDRDDWLRLAEALSTAMTDEVLAAAVRAIPAEAQGADAARILEALRARRDGLVEAAMTFYEVLSPVVDIVGTHDSEFVELERGDDHTLHITVRERRDDGSAGRRVWRRTVAAGETAEVRLWSRGGNDRVEITGQTRAPSEGGAAPGAPLVRVLLGAGDDELADATDGSGVRVYESGPDGLVLESLGPRATVDRTNRVPTAAFGYTPPVMAERRPLLVAGYSAGDGLLLGGGVTLVNPGFGRDPYLRRHRISAAVSTTTLGGFFSYSGTYPDAVGRLDLGLRADAQTPMATQNFFGFGDGPLPEDGGSASFNRVRLASARLEPYAERRLPGGMRLYAGPSLSYARPEVDSARFIATAGVPERDLASQVFAGASAGVEIDAVDDPVRPSRGARFDGSLRARLGMIDAGHAFAGVSSSLRLYFTWWKLPGVTLAVRSGGEHVFGTFPFYEAATMGGAATLRGFRTDRFAGRTTIFGGVEPRITVTRFRSLFAPYGHAGVLAFADAGRVWADELGSSWRTGFGGGVWVALAGRASATATYEVSRERSGLAMRLGFDL